MREADERNFETTGLAVIRAVTYARVSGDDSKNDGLNLKSQIDMCRTYALENKYQIIAELAEDDRGASGADIDLPQLNRVREMAENGKFDVLVVREIDRLSRNLAKQLIVEEELKRAGVKIEYVLADYEDTPEGRLSKHIRATIAEYEREKIRERMVRGRQNSAMTGKALVARHPPYGYRVEDGTFIIYEPEAKIVKWIFEMYVEERLSPGKICKKLNEVSAPLPTKSAITRNRVGWIRSTVIRILKNETYTGTWYYGKKNGRTNKMNPREKWIPVSVPELVSRDMFETAQSVIEENKRKAPVKKRNYLVSGRIRCTRCRQMLVGSGSGKKVYYRPSRSKVEVYHKCVMPSLRAKWVDETVWDWIQALLLDPQQLERGLNEYQQQRTVRLEPTQNRLSIIKGLEAENRGKYNRLLETYLNGDFPREMLDEQKQRIESAIEKLNEERVKLEAQLHQNELTEEGIQTIKMFAAQAAKGLQKADFATKRNIIELLNVQVLTDVDGEEKILTVECHLGISEYQAGRLPSQTRNGWRGLRVLIAVQP